MTDCDAIVIGAGNGGLIAATTLASQGSKVLLLEQHNIPGGCATSFIRGRFEFEVSLHQGGAIGSKDNPGPVRLILDRLGVSDKITFLEEQHLYRSIVPGQMDVTLPADREETIQALQAQFPHERDAIRGFFDFLYGFLQQSDLFAISSQPDTAREKHPLFFKYALKTAPEVVDEFFRDPLLKMALLSYWSYQGSPPDELSFLDLAVIFFEFLENKPWHVVGGSQAVSSVLLDRFIELGGEVRFSCGAERILLSNGQVCGVVTEHGDEITTRTVISNASPYTTYFDMVGAEHAPAAALDTLRHKTPGYTFFVVYLGLDREPEELGIDVGVTFIHEDLDLNRIYAKSRTLEDQGLVLFSSLDIPNPTISPPGCSQAALANVQFGDQWLRLPPEQYVTKKRQRAENMFKMVEQIHPALRSAVEEMEIASPLTFMRYLNHPGGANLGFEHTRRDFEWFYNDGPNLMDMVHDGVLVDYFFRTPGSRTPIERLFMAGAWAGRGAHSYAMCSGYLAAHTALKELNGG